MTIRQLEAFHGLMQAQLQSGALKRVHEFLEGGRGYFITGESPPEKILEGLAIWAPFVIFEIHQTVKMPRALEIAIAIAKQRAAMMKEGFPRPGGPSEGPLRLGATCSAAVNHGVRRSTRPRKYRVDPVRWSSRGRMNTGARTLSASRPLDECSTGSRSNCT
jgi:hypothetical protein